MQTLKTVYMNLKMVWGLYVSHFCLTFVGSVLSGHLWGCVSLGMAQAIWSLETISELLMNTERMGWTNRVASFQKLSIFIMLSQVLTGDGGELGCAVKESAELPSNICYSTDPSQRATLACGLASLEVTLLHKTWYHSTHIIKTSIKH